MSEIDYIIVKRWPLARIRELPIGVLVGYLESCEPVTRQALDVIFRAH